MRATHICAAGLIFLFIVGPSASRSAPADIADITLAYPAEVALSDEGDKGFVFRRFPGSQRLYTYDLDKTGQSACNVGCYQAWPPVLAPSNAKPIGDWTIIERQEGVRQWAYKGQPVYTLYHDEPGKPAGDGQAGVWHLLPYMKRPQN